MKVRGYRVERGEVEAVLAAHPAVSRAVVSVRESGDGSGNQIVGYVVAEESGDGDGIDEQLVEQWRNVYNDLYDTTQHPDTTTPSDTTDASETSGVSGGGVVFGEDFSGWRSSYS
ncbi:AMP-binding enzyme, partial [Nocardia nova]|uniref:AMP-binding enzyme n=2 Tax=Nocardia TaxID=1817 RepID=UPI002B4B5985